MLSFYCRCDRERVAILFNPASGSADVEARRRALAELARAGGIRCTIAETDPDRGAGPLAAQAVADGMERVLISGGDGSVAEVADTLAGTSTALAVLPAGTGNLLALNLGIPLDCEDAFQLALDGEARPIDVGRANGVLFLIMAGIGLDARVIHQADRDLKKRLGFLAYVVATLRNLWGPSSVYTIRIDGRVLRRRAKTVLVANLGRITGGIDLVPGTDPDDGLLEVAIVRARNAGALIRLGFRAILRRPLDDSLMEVYRGREILIETPHPLPVQLDGNEGTPSTRLEVRVEPGALRLVRGVPAEPPGNLAQTVQEAVNEVIR